MIVVSMTTTTSRLGLCRAAISSLIGQSVRPDKIILWVSKEPYLKDSGVDSTASVMSYIKSVCTVIEDVVEVRCTQNIGPYRKLIPILRECQEKDIIITADDDVFYGYEWLSKLLSAYQNSCKGAVASRVRIKQCNMFGAEMSYLYWPICDKSVFLNNNYIITFGGGAVVSKSLFDDSDIDDNGFLEVGPTADDLWYSKLLERAGAGVKVVPEALNELNFFVHDEGLEEDNSPKTISLYHKVRLRIWDYVVGRLGVSVCNNDVAYKNIERYFRNK